MKRKTTRCVKTLAATFIASSALAGAARAEWQRDGSTVAWRDHDRVVWQFSFDAKFGKPFFNPIGVVGGPSLINFKPEDHPWHYGLWFSWKYINGVNYWEEDRATGKPEGATRWSEPKIETHPDGSAKISMELVYRHPTGRVDLTETRELTISAPDAAGGFTIDWRAKFVAGERGALLNRTPMPGEPEGKVNGGYAGLSVRLAPPPLEMHFVSSEGAVEQFTNGRARPFASAVAANFSEGGQPAGALAIFSDAANAGENAPWYLINDKNFRFACAAILAPKPIHLDASATLNLHYRIAVRRAPWTPDELKKF